MLKNQNNKIIQINMKSPLKTFVYIEEHTVLETSGIMIG